MISKLHLKNFIAFTDLSIDFSPGINIIIGENGTGKTQLLRAILAMSGQPRPHSGTNRGRFDCSAGQGRLGDGQG